MEQLSGHAIVNAGCLLFFDEKLTSSRRNDVLDSLLYVQLAAFKKHPKFTEQEEWKDTWLTAAVRFGWVWTAGTHCSEPASRTETQTPWSLCAGALSAVVEDAVIADAERALREQAHAEALKLLASQTLQIDTGQDRPARTTLVLQIGFVDAFGGMSLALIYLNTYQPLTPGLVFEPLEAGHLLGNIDVTVYSMRLLDQVYGQFRAAFDNALAGKRSGLIKPLGKH